MVNEVIRKIEEQQKKLKEAMSAVVQKLEEGASA